MAIPFHIPSVLRRYSDGAAEVTLEASTASEALERLVARFPQLAPRLFDRSGLLFPYLILYRNEDALDRAHLGDEPVREGDVLELVGAAEGGAPGDDELKALERGGAGGRDIRMKGFRERTSVAQAVALALEGVRPLEGEAIAPWEACGRVLAEDVHSGVAVPSFRRAAMDGYAVRGEDTFGAQPYDPVALRLAGESMPGAAARAHLARGEACRIMTGAPVPEGADAVLMAEHAEEADGPGGRAVLARASVAPGKHVGQIGEDIAAGDRALERGRRLRPQDVGLLASIGEALVRVVQRPRVRVLVTGNELLAPGERPRGTSIVDSNTPMLCCLVERDGGVVAEALRLPDDPEAIESALARQDVDVLIAAGGSSVGREDHLPMLVRKLGALRVHGIAMRPSAPAGLGAIGAVRVFLLPGNPVSCLAAYDVLAGPVVRALGGLPARAPYRSVALPLARALVSQVGRLDYARIVLTEDGRAEPLAVSGASLLSSTTRAAGYALVPAELEGHGEGERVRVFFYDALEAEEAEEAAARAADPDTSA